MVTRQYGAGSGDFDGADDDQPLTPGSVPEGPVSAAPGPRAWGSGEDDAAMDDLNADGILESLPVGVIVFDADQNLRYANPEHVGLLGVDLGDCDSVEGWLRAGCRDAAYAEEVIADWREHIWQKQLTRVFSLKNAADQLREIEFTPRLLSSDLVVVLRDVTESRQAENALRLMELKFGAVFESANDGIALVDATGRFLDVNPAFEALLGRTRSELRRLSLADCVAFSDIERLRAAEAQLMSQQGLVPDSTLLNRREFRGEEAIRLRPREGEVFPVEVSLSVARGARGRAIYSVLWVPGASEPDTTGETEERESLVRQGLAFRYLEEAIIVTNLRGRILDCNAAAERIFGYGLGEIAGEGLARLYAPEGGADALNAEVSRALTEHGRWESRRTFFRKDGSAGEAEVVFLPVEESGAPRSLLGIHREVSERSPDRDAAEKMQHRWRNQLQAVHGLLSLELSGRGEAEGALLAKVIGRLKAVSRLHEMAESIGSPVSLVRYARGLAGDLRRMSVSGEGGADHFPLLEVRDGEATGEVRVDFEVATTFGLLMVEVGLALFGRGDGNGGDGRMVLDEFEGHPRMRASLPSAVMTGFSLPVLRALVEQLDGSLKVSHREDRAEWILRFPASR